MNVERLIRPLGLTLIAALAGCTVPGQPAEGEGAPTSAAPPPVKVDLPPLIKLEGTIPPETHADLKLRVDGLLARRQKYLGQKIIVRGYVVEKSECPKDAKRCERAHVWLADTPAGGDKRLMVVGLRDGVHAQMVVGEQRVVTGKFARRSDDGFVMSGGLLVFEGMEGMLPLDEDGKPTKGKRRGR